ncbi:MAG: glycosyltransferase family 39 protein, partial [Patescibacteria group bacterium]
HFLRLPIQSLLTRIAVHMGAGAAVLIALLWFFALGNMLVQPAVAGLLLGIPMVGYRFSWDWLKRLWQERWITRQTIFSGAVLLSFLLLSYLAFNFLTVIRPFPIGWDDLGRYINNPRQIASFGHIIPGMIAIQWEYLSALGFVLFGYESTFGSTFAMEINWFSGVLAVLAILACTRVVLGPRTGLIAALVYYSLPMVGHFSYADMKTENAIFAFGALGFLAAMLAFTDEREGDALLASRRLKWLFVSGVLFGAAFGTKPTIILLFLVAGIFLTTMHLGAVSGVGAAFLSLFIMMKGGAISIPTILERITGGTLVSQSTAATFFLLLGLLLLLLPQLLQQPRSPLEMRKRLTPFFFSSITFCFGFILFISPWTIRNMGMSDRLTFPALSAPNTITPWIEYSAKSITPAAPEGSRGLPPELAINPDHEQCRGTAREEELERYWGFGAGPMHYLGLPWRIVMNTDAQGYYVMTSPLLLLVPLLLLLPFFYRTRLLRLLFFGTLFYVVLWMVLASGIPWYGIGMFLGLAILVEALYDGAPNRISRIASGLLLTIGLLLSFSFRSWQFDMQESLYEYPWGKASANVLMEMTVPDYDDIAENVMRLTRERPEQPYLYRMGTFISYFVPQNLKIITLNDNQLGFFNCLNQEGDHLLTLKRLLALGFHSIIFDTNTATIEKDPNGTLHQKVNRFLEFANDASLGITSVVNNSNGGVAYMILPERAPEAAAAGEEAKN